MGLSRTQFIHL